MSSLILVALEEAGSEFWKGKLFWGRKDCMVWMDFFRIELEASLNNQRVSKEFSLFQSVIEVKRASQTR